MASGRAAWKSSGGFIYTMDVLCVEFARSAAASPATSTAAPAAASTTSPASAGGSCAAGSTSAAHAVDGFGWLQGERLHRRAHGRRECREAKGGRQKGEFAPGSARGRIEGVAPLTKISEQALSLLEGAIPQTGSESAHGQ